MDADPQAIRHATISIRLKIFIGVHLFEAFAVLVLMATTMSKLGAWSPSGKHMLVIALEVVPILLLYVIGTFQKWRWVPYVATLYYFFVAIFTVIQIFWLPSRAVDIRDIFHGNFVVELLSGALLALLVQCLCGAYVFWTERTHFRRSAV